MRVAKDRVYELRKELVFWERLYENDAPCEREFRLQEQIEALENRDQFGIPQFSIPQYTDYMYWDSNTDDVIVDPPKCKHCGTTTHWGMWNGKFRLLKDGKPHVCNEYRKIKLGKRLT